MMGPRQESSAAPHRQSRSLGKWLFLPAAFTLRLLSGIPNVMARDLPKKHAPNATTKTVRHRKEERQRWHKPAMDRDPAGGLFRSGNAFGWMHIRVMCRRLC